jgi:hypothetical protein
MKISYKIGVLSCVSISASVFSMPYGLGCATDIDINGNVGVSDVLAIIDSWGTSDAIADCNGDGTVGVGDLLMLIDEWGTDCDSIHPFIANTVVTFDYVNAFVIVETNGIPDHATGPFDGSTGCFNPNSALPQDRTYRIPMVPTPTATPAIELLDQPGPVSVTVNGVPFYNPYDAGGIDAPATICFDDFNGHPQLFGEYHYHQWSPALDAMENDGHSGVIGYSFDGYPIFGPWESENVDAHNGVVNPLDVCHGHTDSIRGYHYHTSLPYSEDPNGFPWVMGCYSGEPELSNFDAGGGGGGCDSCAQHMIPPAVCNCVHTTPEYAYCCMDWDANCQAYAEEMCDVAFTGENIFLPEPPPTRRPR